MGIFSLSVWQKRTVPFKSIFFFFVLALCFDVALFFKNYNRMLILSSKSDVKKTFFIKVILSS